MNAKTREMLLVWDSTDANPNGDMLSDNRPRQDELTGKIEVSACRIKRFVKDYMKVTGHAVFTTTEVDDKGKVLTAKAMADKVAKDKGVNKKDVLAFEKALQENYIDARLFGYVVTDPKANKTGPLNVTWTRSVNASEVEFIKGSSAFASSDGKENTTFSERYKAPYALFSTYMVYNNLMAKSQGISVCDEDIEIFKTCLIQGMKTYRSHSKNQMPRMLVEVIYKENYIDGELNYLDFNYDIEDESLRHIGQVEICLDRLEAYYNKNLDQIEEVNVYLHDTVKVTSMPQAFNVKSLH